MKEKKWFLLTKEQSAKSIEHREVIGDLINTLLRNRGIKTKKDIDEFLRADLSSVTTTTVGIDQKQLTKALKRIQKAIEGKEQIVVFGDYDVDGITGTAILWETLYALGANVVPYIPNRIDEGYGLSIKGIENIRSVILSKEKDLDSSAKPQNDKSGLIITVDNGIVANEAVDFANENGIDIIITDHHTVGKTLPKAHAIVHTTAVCGAGVAYLLAQAISNIQSYSSSEQSESRSENSSSRLRSNSKVPQDHLSLVALATVADLVPLTGANRILLRFGLAELRETKRPGLLALFQEAEIDPANVGVYEIGHIIAPRLNAMGRLESAMDSLRLLCTKDRLKGKVLADTLGRTNRERQVKTQSAAMHALEHFRQKSHAKRLLFIAHEDYEEGIIGLVAGKLVEEYYLPAIVLSKGEKISKASARSIAGFNIIDFIRTHSPLLINAGGHPMAAGFTVETEKIALLQEALEKLAEESIDKDILQRILRIDCELPVEMVTPELFMKLQTLSPFGMGNPEPTFVSKAMIQEVKTVGKEKKHLKLKIKPYSSSEAKTNREVLLDAIAFGFGEMVEKLKPGDVIDMVYTISENIWNGKVSLQLKVKDIKRVK